MGQAESADLELNQRQQPVGNKNGQDKRDQNGPQPIQGSRDYDRADNQQADRLNTIFVPGGIQLFRYYPYGWASLRSRTISG